MAVRQGNRRPRRRRLVAGHGSVPKSRPSLWATIGVIASIVLTSSLGLLNVLGIGAGPVVTAITVLLLAGTFVASSHKLLSERFPDSSPRVRATVAGAIASCVALLLVVGLATRPEVGLHRLPGPQDIAIAGIRAAEPDDQQLLDDVASTVSRSLSETSDGEVHDYSSDADAPLRQLRSLETGQLDDWALDFTERTGAEIVLAGDFVRTGFEGTSALIAVYVSPSMIGEASELGGWFRIARIRVDRSLASASARDDFLARLEGSVGGLSSFLRGLDAWEAGHYEDALEELRRASRGDEPVGSALAHLIRLFTGHAEESLALTEQVSCQGGPAQVRAGAVRVARGLEGRRRAGRSSASRGTTTTGTRETAAGQARSEATSSRRLWRPSGRSPRIRRPRHCFG